MSNRSDPSHVSTRSPYALRKTIMAVPLFGQELATGPSPKLDPAVSYCNDCFPNAFWEARWAALSRYVFELNGAPERIRTSDPRFVACQSERGISPDDPRGLSYR